MFCHSHPFPYVYCLLQRHRYRECYVYPNSHHSFDRDMDIKTVDHAYSLTDCRLTLSSSGVVKTEEYGFPLYNSTLQKIGLYFCADRGPSYGGNKAAKQASSLFSKAFISKHLLR